MSKIVVFHGLAVVLDTVVIVTYVADTAYDKTSKTLVLKNLIDLVTLGRGLDWTLVELNKALSLCGLTTLLLSFMPLSILISSSHLYLISLVSLGVHSAYSTYKFYSFSLARLMNEVRIKQISVLLGSLCQVLLYVGFLGYATGPALALGAVALGLGHFWSMEVDFKYRIQVRPFAFLPFILGAAVVGRYAWGAWKGAL